MESCADAPAARPHRSARSYAALVTMHLVEDLWAAAPLLDHNGQPMLTDGPYAETKEQMS